MRQTIRFFTLTVLLTTLLLGLRHADAQSSIQNLIITKTDASGFPQIAIQFRPLDSQGLPVSAVQQDNLELKEDGQSVTPENLTTTEAGLWVHFVVDAGLWLDDKSTFWGNTDTSIRDFLQTTPWMKENLDQVALSLIEGNQIRTLTPFAATPDLLLSSLGSFSPRENATTHPLSALEELLDTFSLVSEAKNQARFIVLFSPGLENGSPAEVAALAEQADKLGIPIYVIYVRSGSLTDPTYRPALLRTLAEESGGLFAQYNRLTDIAPLYEQLKLYRPQQILSYRSSVNQSGTHQLELIANVGAAGGNVSSTTDYTVEVNPPRVIVTNPTTAVIHRTAPEYTADRSTLSPTSVTVVAQIIFPDNHLRRLPHAVLLQDGVEVNRLQNPNPTQDIELEWGLRDIQQDGVNDFSLEVEITDELGMVSRSPAVAVKVDVTVPPKPAESVATPDVDAIRDQIADDLRTEIEGSLSVPTITCFAFTPPGLCEKIERPLRRNWVSALSITISLTFAVVVWAGRKTAPVRAVTETVRRGVETITKRYRGPAEARAYLIVLEGDVNVGKRLELFGDTPIGRSKQVAELLFQQHDDNSPISRLHCTLIDEEDHFMIKDEDSANGTFLNGSKLPPLDLTELHDNDELELGRVERGGVRLLFQLARPGEGGDSQVGRVTKPTRSQSKSNTTTSSENAANGKTLIEEDAF